MARKSRRISNGSSGIEGIGFLIIAFIALFWESLKQGELWAILLACGIVITSGVLVYFLIIRKHLIKKPIPSITMNEIDKMTGLEFEHFVGDLFIAMGYRAEVTQASNDYGADVIVNKDQIKSVIQVKNYKNPVGFGAIQEVISAKGYYKADEAIVITNSPSFTRQAQRAAKQLRVQIIAREDLQKLLDKYLPPLPSILISDRKGNEKGENT